MRATESTRIQDGRIPVPAADTDAVVGTFRLGEAVHVSGAIDAGLVAEMHAAADDVFRDWTALTTADRLDEKFATPLQRRFIPLSYLPVAPDRLDALLHPSLRRMAHAYLDKDPQIEPNSHVRSILLDRADAHLPFHQDQTILNRRLLNVWIPLDACGAEAPGLEVVWGSWNELLAPSPAPDAAFPVERARLDPAEVCRRYGTGAFWRPHFRAGDAMIFSGATIHRTHVSPGMTRDRMSVEIRLL